MTLTNHISLHLDNSPAPALPVLLHHDVVHPRRQAFERHDDGVALCEDELAVGVEDTDAEVAFLLQVDSNLVGGGVGMDV